MCGVTVTYKQYVDQAVPQVLISFQLDLYDWLQLSKSRGWSQVEKMISEMQQNIATSTSGDPYTLER